MAKKYKWMFGVVAVLFFLGGMVWLYVWLREKECVSEKAYSIEVPLYLNVFEGVGYDRLSNSDVNLPYEILLHKFVPDTLIDNRKQCYSSIVIRDKRSQEFVVEDLLQEKPVKYGEAMISLLKYSYSSETENMYFIVVIEEEKQIEMERWCSFYVF